MIYYLRMSPEIVKQLKDAGWNFKCFCRGTIACLGPELEELIQAIGGKSFDLSADAYGKWVARSYIRAHSEDGATPAEAVARLWLALNPKL